MASITQLRKRHGGFYAHLPQHGPGTDKCTLCGMLPASSEHAVARRRTYARELESVARVIEDEAPAHQLHDNPPEARAHAQTHVQDDSFFTEVNGRTVFTGPMRRDIAATAEGDSEHPYLLRLQGYFVGADEPNRNGAMWTTADLMGGVRSVPHGPLNWLHEGRKVIGAITDAQFAVPHDLVGAEKAGVPSKGHIKARSAVWRWLYPQEAAFIESSIEAGHAYYSMECIGRAVECADHGCGQFEYAKAMRGDSDVCEHVRTRSGNRRIVDPVFLGGAAIVPPARPGWADAHIGLMDTAAPLAEAASAARGDLGDREWETLMALVVRFAIGA